VSEETETRPLNGADGLIAGMTDVMAMLSLAVCHSMDIEPAAFANSMLTATENTISPSTPAEYAAGRRLAAARVAETLRGVGLPATNASGSRSPAWPGFQVILGGLAAGSVVERSAQNRDGTDKGDNPDDHGENRDDPA
jgi:hypothetical protein